MEKKGKTKRQNKKEQNNSAIWNFKVRCLKYFIIISTFVFSIILLYKKLRENDDNSVNYYVEECLKIETNEQTLATTFCKPQENKEGIFEYTNRDVINFLNRLIENGKITNRELCEGKTSLFYKGKNGEIYNSFLYPIENSENPTLEKFCPKQYAKHKKELGKLRRKETNKMLKMYKNECLEGKQPADFCNDLAKLESYSELDKQLKQRE